MEKNLTIACLILGVIGVFAQSLFMKREMEKAKTEVAELEARNGLTQYLLDRCVMDRAEKLAFLQEENVIPWPTGRLHPREVDLHALINAFLEENERICFSKNWMAGKVLD